MSDRSFGNELENISFKVLEVAPSLQEIGSTDILTNSKMAGRSTANQSADGNFLEQFIKYEC